LPVWYAFFDYSTNDVLEISFQTDAYAERSLALSAPEVKITKKRHHPGHIGLVAVAFFYLLALRGVGVCDACSLFKCVNVQMQLSHPSMHQLS
jgi:hypothetical protein